MTRNLLYSGVSAASAIFMLGLLAVAGRRLGQVEYGAFMWAISLATVAEVFMDFGLHQVTIRSIAKVPSDAGRVFRTSLRLKIVPGIAMVLVFGVLAARLRTDPTVRTVAWLLLLSAVTRSYILTARGILQGLERFGDDAVVTVLDRALLFVCCVAALLGGASVVPLAVVFLGARSATTLVALDLVRRRIGPSASSGYHPWRILTAEALPVGMFLLVLNLYNRVDTLMLGVIVDSPAVAFYNTAYPLYEGLTYASAVITAVLVPRLSRSWSVDRPAFERLVRLSIVGTAALAVVVAAGAWPFAEWGIRLVFGAEYAEATGAFRWLLVGLPFIYVIWVLHSVAIAAHRTEVLVWVTAGGTIFNVALNLWLIPRYSYTGAAAATVASELVTVVLLLWGLRTTLGTGPVVSGDGLGD